MSIELIPGKTCFTTKIETDMSPEVQEEVINYLGRNTDVFAFSVADLKGIDRNLAEHKLNVDPTVKPVKHKLRSFRVPSKNK